MNGPTAKSLAVALSFLGSGKYEAVLVRDSGDNAAAVRIEKAVHARGDAVKISLAGGGGFVARFTPAGSARSPRRAE